jgi:plasmid maintenance system antidote protein VapI
LRRFAYFFAGSRSGAKTKVFEPCKTRRGYLLNGKAALSPEMALRIEKAFGVNMDILLRMQAWYDAKTMRRRAGEIHVRRYKPPAVHPH